MNHFVSTPAELSGCPCCPMPVLRAVDEGVPACVDLLPLAGPAAQAAAFAAGLATYARMRDGSLAYRDPSRLTDPNLSPYIHAQHACPTRSTR